MYLKNLNKRCLLHQKSELSHPQPKYCLTPRLYQANVINTSQNKPRKVGGRKGRCVGYYGSPRGPYLLRIKWKNQDIQYYSVKGLGGRHFNSCIFVLCWLLGQQLVFSQSDQQVCLTLAWSSVAFALCLLIEKKLPIVTLRWPNVTLRWPNVTLRWPNVTLPNVNYSGLKVTYS